MKKVIFSLFLFGATFADSRADMPVFESGLLYRVRMDLKQPCEFIQIRTEPDPQEFRPQKTRLSRMIFLAPNRKTVLQKFPDLLHDGADFDASWVEYGDFNFDGYRDFRVYLYGVSGSAGRRYWHYLFNSKTRRYEASHELNQLTSTSFDGREKVVRSYERNGGMYSLAGNYRWRAEKLVLISEVLRGHDEKKGYFTQYSDFTNPDKPKARRVYLSDEPDIK